MNRGSNADSLESVLVSENVQVRICTARSNDGASPHLYGEEQRYRVKGRSKYGFVRRGATVSREREIKVWICTARSKAGDHGEFKYSFVRRGATVVHVQVDSFVRRGATVGG